MNAGSILPHDGRANYLNGWAFSLVFHGLVTTLAIALTTSLHLPPEKNVFRWQVAVLDPPVPAPPQETIREPPPAPQSPAQPAPAATVAPRATRARAELRPAPISQETSLQRPETVQTVESAPPVRRSESVQTVETPPQVVRREIRTITPVVPGPPAPPSVAAPERTDVVHRPVEAVDRGAQPVAAQIEQVYSRTSSEVRTMQSDAVVREVEAVDRNPQPVVPETERVHSRTSSQARTMQSGAVVREAGQVRQAPTATVGVASSRPGAVTQPQEQARDQAVETTVAQVRTESSVREAPIAPTASVQHQDIRVQAPPIPSRDIQTQKPGVVTRPQELLAKAAMQPGVPKPPAPVQPEPQHPPSIINGAPVMVKPGSPNQPRQGFGWLREAIKRSEKRKPPAIEHEGVTLFRIHYRQEGNSVILVKSSIEKSSGYADVDRAAERVVRDAFPIELNEPLLQRELKNVQIPVRIDQK